VQVPTVLKATTVNAPLVVTSGVHSAACADGMTKLVASKSQPKKKEKLFFNFTTQCYVNRLLRKTLLPANNHPGFVFVRRVHYLGDNTE
jgi:hypothetical protein